MNKIVPLCVMFCIGSAAFGGVVIQMPVAPATTPVAAATSTTPAVSPLQRFAIGERAKDRAGNVVLYTLPPTVTSGGGGNGWGGGSGYGGYGYGGFGYGGFGWRYPLIYSPCCRPNVPCEPLTPVWGGGSGVFINVSF